MSDIQVLVVRLPNGEELIGRVMETRPGVDMLMEKVQVIRTRWNSNGSADFGFIPFMPYAKDDVVRIPISPLVAFADCTPPLEKAYLEHTSGIILAN